MEQRITELENQLKLVEQYSVAGFWNAMDAAYRTALQDRTLECIICSHRASSPAFQSRVARCDFGGGELVRHECPICGCLFGPMKYLDLSEDFVQLDYRLLYSRYSEGNSTASEVLAFETLEPKQGALYLDWGCGGAWSKTIEQLRSAGFDVWGYEPSVEPSGFVVNHRDQISAKFDGIFSNNVIEHFRSPVEQFRYFASILKPDGKMAHQSPCYAYEYANTRFHTLFLLGESPYILAERTGFQARRVQAAADSINYVFTKK